MHQITRDNNRLCLLLFKISHFTFLTYCLLGHIPMFTVLLKVSTYLGIVLLIANFFIQYNNSSIESFFTFGVLLVFSLVHSYFSGNFALFKLLLFSGSIVRLDLRDIIRFDMYLRGALIILVAVLCQLGIAPDVIVPYYDSVRHSMGFTNPNTLGIAAFILVCDIFYVYNLKLSFKLLVIVTVFTLWVDNAAKSRTALYAIVAIMIVSFIYRVFPRLFETKVFRAVLYITPFVLSLATLIVTRSYLNGGTLGMEADDLLSGRIDAIGDFAKLLSPTLFGQPIHKVLNRSLDNTIAFIWYDLGILVFILFNVAYILTIKHNLKYDIPLCVIVFSFMIYGLSEHLWIYVDYNIFLLAFCYRSEPVRYSYPEYEMPDEAMYPPSPYLRNNFRM